ETAGQLLGSGVYSDGVRRVAYVPPRAWEGVRALQDREGHNKSYPAPSRLQGRVFNAVLLLFQNRVSFVGKVRVPAKAAPREYTLWHPHWRWRHRTGRYKDGGRSYENKNFALAVHVGGSRYCRAGWRSSGAAAGAATTFAGRGASSATSAACANRR